MKIQLKSDLHNEYTWGTERSLMDPFNPDDRYINPEADIIVLAGDITTRANLDSIKHVYGNCGKPVLYVPGNHEYYGTDFKEMQELLDYEFKDEDIYVLNPGSIIIEGILFVGATLWTDLKKDYTTENMASTWSEFVGERYGTIGGYTPEDWTTEHNTNKNFINHCLKESSLYDVRKTVVISHYLPSNESVPLRFKGDSYNPFFVNPGLLENMENPPDLWLHGHTHDSCDYIIGKTRVVCNPYGYNGSSLNQDFNPRLLIEI